MLRRWVNYSPKTSECMGANEVEKAPDRFRVILRNLIRLEESFGR